MSFLIRLTAEGCGADTRASSAKIELLAHQTPVAARAINGSKAAR